MFKILSHFVRRSERRTSSLDKADQNRNHGQDEKNVNEPTKCVRADHAQHPEDQQQNGYSPEHWHSSLNLSNRLLRRSVEWRGMARYPVKALFNTQYHFTGRADLRASIDLDDSISHSVECEI